MRDGEDTDSNGREEAIENFFRKKVRKSKKTKNAYLLVHSEDLDIHLNVAEGKTGNIPADPGQPNYMASVGKLLTSTLVSMLYEEGELSFEDSINKYLDDDILDGLHVYRGEDYTDKIQIRHLLNHTSGLPDSFWHLLNKLFENPELEMTPRKTIEWGKENRKPHFPPGEKFYYTDTNYCLLGLIVEEITGMPFHEALKQRIFEPLDMKNSYMIQASEPIEQTDLPLAKFYHKGKDITDLKFFKDTDSYAGIDYAGGGVVAPMEDLLKFMKSLVNHELVEEETLQMMMDDRASFGIGIDYGYGTWILKKIPILMPGKYSSWGVAGVTGAFMFYHPETSSYLIGSFNDTRFKRKALIFMMKTIDMLRR